jgi:hypothetical protein
MSTRQKMRTPTMEIEGESELSACARVAKMMRINSRPYILLRPTMSASQPNPTCPSTVPPLVATLMAVSEEDGIWKPCQLLKFQFEMQQDTAPHETKTSILVLNLGVYRLPFL